MTGRAGRLIGSLLPGVALVALAACGGDRGWEGSGPITAYGLTVPDSVVEDRLVLGTFPEYLPPELLEEFERTYGVDVVMDYYDTNEAFLAKFRAGGVGQYDLAVLSDYAVTRLSSEGLLRELADSLVPNRENLRGFFRGLPYDPELKYTLPYQWGVSGLGIRTDRLDRSPEEAATWATVFEPGGTDVMMMSDPRETIGAALIYLGHSVNSTDPRHLARAESLLVAQRSHILGYGSVSTLRDLLHAGEIAVAHNYSGDVALAAASDTAVTFVVPREGSIVWVDNMTLLRDAPHPVAAHLFMNFILDAQVGARLTDYTYYSTPNEAALPLIDPEVRGGEAFDPDSTVPEGLQFIADRGPARRAFDEVWTRVQVGGR